LGNQAFINCAKLADFAGTDANSIIIDSITSSAFSNCASLTYDMIDKIKTIPGTTKIQDAINKKFIYFKPDNNAAMYTKGNLAYGEIES
jgi:hypothetical protein